MLVKNWMSKTVITIDTNDSMQDAIKLLREHKIRSASLYSIKAGTRRIDGSEKSNASDVTITEKGAPNFSDTDRIKRVSLDLKRPVLHSTGNTTSCT